MELTLNKTTLTLTTLEIITNVTYNIDYSVKIPTCSQSTKKIVKQSSTKVLFTIYTKQIFVHQDNTQIKNSCSKSTTKTMVSYVIN